MRLGLLDQLDHPAKGAVGAHPGRAHAQVAQAGDAGGIDACARPGLDGHGFAGDGRLVHGGLPCQHFAVDGDAITRPHDDDLARLHLGQRHCQLLPAALDARHLRGQRAQVPDGPPRPLGGEVFGVVAHPHKEDHHCRRGPLADHQGGDDAQGHQGV